MHCIYYRYRGIHRRSLIKSYPFPFPPKRVRGQGMGSAKNVDHEPWRTLFGLIMEKPFQGLENLVGWWPYQCSLFELKSPGDGPHHSPGFLPWNKAQPHLKNPIRTTQKGQISFLSPPRKTSGCWGPLRETPVSLEATNIFQLNIRYYKVHATIIKFGKKYENNWLLIFSNVIR